MPTWWIVGAAIYVPLFLLAVIHGVREGDTEPWTAIWASAVFLGVSTASAVFWFG
jgi:hypothetical protein